MKEARHKRLRICNSVYVKLSEKANLQIQKVDYQLPGAQGGNGD